MFCLAGNPMGLELDVYRNLLESQISYGDKGAQRIAAPYNTQDRDLLLRQRQAVSLFQQPGCGPQQN